MKIFILLLTALLPFLSKSQILSASNCNPTPNYPLECQGANINENFNSGPGSFSSDFFKWDSRSGSWKATRIKANQTFYITSGTYRLNQDGYVTMGFYYEGNHRRDLYILDAITGEVLTACAAVAGSWGNRNQVCNIIPMETDKEKFTKGRLIKFQLKYMTFSSPTSTTAIFDNFSVAGSASLVNPTARTYTFQNRFDAFIILENPVTSAIKIKLHELDETVQVQLLNANGQLIKLTIIPAGKIYETIDISNQKAGMYLLMISSPNKGQMVQKIFKTH